MSLSYGQMQLVRFRLPVIAHRCRRPAVAVARRSIQPAFGTNGRPDHQAAEPAGWKAVEGLAEQLLPDALSEDDRAQLARIDALQERIADLRQQRADVDAQLAAAGSAQNAERQAEDMVASAEVAAAQLRLQAAEAAVRDARSASANWETEQSINLERIESGKAAGVAGAVGLAAALPYAFGEVLSRQTSAFAALLGVAGCAVSAVLFGVTYRYALRQDMSNVQLKAGVVAAFGLVRAAGEADALFSAANGATDAVPQVALASGQAMLLFALTARALDEAFRRKFVLPFGVLGSGVDDTRP